MNNADLFADLFERLQRADALPESCSMFYTTDGKRSHYVRRGDPLVPPAAWLASKNTFYNVNPLAVQSFPSSKNTTVGAVNALIAEFDGKDFIEEPEWTPFYVAPDLDAVAADTRERLAGDNLTEERMAMRVKGRQRGALQRAQTAAIDAAYKANPDVYLARALAHIAALPVQPTAFWKSGGGFQCVWLLAETIYLYNPDGTRNLEAYERMSRLYKRWVAFVGADPAASDLRRVFRWVGSRNFKPKYAPDYPTVELLDCDLDRVYSLDFLTSLLPADKPKRERRKVHAPKGVAPDLVNAGDVPELPKHPAIDKFNRDHDLRQMLLDCDYAEAPGGRLSRPGGDSGGVELRDNNTAWIYSSADPLFSERPITPAHVAVVYWHDGDLESFLRTLPGHTAFRQAVAAARQFVTATRFEPYIDPDLVCVRGYRTDSTDTKVADALIDLVVKHGAWTFKASYAELQRLIDAGSASTPYKAVERLSPWFVTVEPSDDGKTIFTVNTEVVCRSNGVVVDTADPFDLHTTYSTEKAKDAWQTGATREIRRKARQAVAICAEHNAPFPDPGVDDPKAPSPVAQWLDGHVAKGYGETSLRVVYMLEELGEATRQELADATGKSKGSIAAATRRLEAEGILWAEREHSRAAAVYSLADDHMGIVEELAPHLRTHNMAAERSAAGWESTVKRMKRDIERHYDLDAPFTLSPEALEETGRKLAWAKNKWAAALTTLHPEWSAAEVNRFVDAKSTDIKLYTITKLKLDRIRRESVRENRDELIQLRQQMRSQGLDAETQRRHLLYAGYTVRDLQHVGLGMAA